MTALRSGGGVVGLWLALLLSGCGMSASPASYHGAVWLSWTIAGQPVSPEVCASIDHLVITVESTPSVGVEIEPVSCSRGASWQRGDVPEGSDTIVLDAVGPTGRATFEATSSMGVTESAPAAPTVIDLHPL